MGEKPLTKAAEYAQLVARRKECSLCAGLVNPARCEGGRFDSDQIGPWSRWQGDLNADLMVVGQDWGDTRYFVRYCGVEGPANPTNDTLRELLASVGIEIETPQDATDGGRVFFTNAILCLKTEGGLQGEVEKEWFSNCGRAFLRPLIEIIQPKVVVCLGKLAWRSVATEFGYKPGRFKSAVEAVDGLEIVEGVVALAVYHCGARILNTHRKRDQQLRDWQRVRRLLGRS